MVKAVVSTKRDDRTITVGGRTGLRQAWLANGTLSEGPDHPGSELAINNMVLHLVSFRSPSPLRPGTIRHLRSSGSGEAKLDSQIRVVSCKLRHTGDFDITAEFF